MKAPGLPRATGFCRPSARRQVQSKLTPKVKTNPTTARAPTGSALQDFAPKVSPEAVAITNVAAAFWEDEEVVEVEGEGGAGRGQSARHRSAAGS